MTVTVNTADNKTYTVYSLKDNTSSKLNYSSGNGSVSFKLDGSSFYALCRVSDKTPGSTSPQTGDNSNLALWIALLFVSGGAVVVTTVYVRKKKCLYVHGYERLRLYNTSIHDKIEMMKKENISNWFHFINNKLCHHWCHNYVMLVNLIYRITTIEVVKA